jgi:hypothetical protein
VEFPKLSRVKLKAGFLRGLWKERCQSLGCLLMTQVGTGPGLVPRLRLLRSSRIDPQPFRVCVGTRK